jgi:hypothetical protein
MKPEMYAEYPARYRDEHGEEETTLRNDGKTLRMRVRGVEFSGAIFDDFEPEEGTDASALAPFRLSQNALYGYTIDFDMPMPTVANGVDTEAILHVRVALGVLDERGGLDREEIHLTLRYADNEYCGSGHSGWFEDELLEIQKTLPEGVYMQACINCAFSDYSPYGHQVFGDMACFRDNKEGYLQVNSKADIFRVWGTATELVQETYLCPEFQRRKPGMGYRG